MKNPNQNNRLPFESWLAYSLIAVVFSCFAISAGAEGFRNPPPSSFGLGRSGGRIAQVDDSSAVAHNPANLVDLTNSEAQFTPSIVYIASKYTSASGSVAETEQPWKLLPNLFLAIPAKNSNIVYGFSVTVPYGLSVVWDKNSAAYTDPSNLRYQAPHHADLKTINANPTIAFKLNDDLSLGLGADIMWSQLTLKQLYPWAFFPGSIGTESDGNIHLKGDGFGYGANIGLTWRLTQRQRLAVTYRSPIDVNYDGDFKIDNLTPTASALGVTSKTDLSTKIKFPAIVSLGYGIQLTESFRLETDVEWIQFSRFKTLNLNVGNDAILFPATSFAENWKDTFTIGIGGDWQINPEWTIRAGYQFYESPVPDSTLSPTIPDANQNVFTVGLAYRHNHHSIEAAYGLDFYDTRNISNNQNPALNGKYDFTVHLFSLAYRYSF